MVQEPEPEPKLGTGLDAYAEAGLEAEAAFEAALTAEVGAWLMGLAPVADDAGAEPTETGTVELSVVGPTGEEP